MANRYREAYRGFPTDLESVIMYLRKSREDQEAEEKARREGERLDVLSRHRKRLLDLARECNYNIVGIYEEVVSGELVDERPEMIRLLERVESGDIDGVLTVHIDRLGRGDSADQGIIQRAFRDSETLIITPEKVYDLLDDNDEEQVEFKAFFARRELKRITKRMQDGRVDSVKEGKFIGTYEPYGYTRDRNVGLKLIPGERADVVRMIFDWYVNEGMGGPTIAQRLESMGLPSPSNEIRVRYGKPVDPKKVWKASTINAILKNEVYIGRVQWRKTKTVRRRQENGRYKKIKSVDRAREEWVEQKGTHEPLVTIEQFEKAQQLIAERSNREYTQNRKPQNPLKGLIICKICGTKMQRRPYERQAPHLICPTKGCNRSSQFTYVEQKLLDALRAWYNEYKVQYDLLEKQMKRERKNKIPTNLIDEVEREIAATREQKSNLHTLLERGIYDADTFLERNKLLMEVIEKLEVQRSVLIEEIEKHESIEDARTNVIPMVRHVLDVYEATEDVKERNNLLKQVVERVEYFKAPDWVDDQFELSVYPRMG
ncbi:recombinase family protein [Tumebacillus sp. DT12]|uniref:Recombinase family protein n=1 Tax=Tumebacillus lacus TaxID=2995335 RepID=A0ABT3X388_9BACL|nr:recombinase family protein [Tumebacillus lacus]MCX7570432.1 recombinase family protein [Tumebacillus lacus]